MPGRAYLLISKAFSSSHIPHVCDSVIKFLEGLTTDKSAIKFRILGRGSCLLPKIPSLVGDQGQRVNRKGSLLAGWLVTLSMVGGPPALCTIPECLWFLCHSALKPTIKDTFPTREPYAARSPGEWLEIIETGRSGSHAVRLGRHTNLWGWTGWPKGPSVYHSLTSGQTHKKKKGKLLRQLGRLLPSSLSKE